VDGQGNPWVYRRREWFTRTVVTCEVEAPEALPYRPGGVYVLIGGAGGLGEVLSEHLIRRYQAQMVWIGRRPLDRTIQRKIDRLASCGGPAPHYIRADAADRSALARAYDEITERFSTIHGVVHAAIVLLDKSLANMDEERFRAGLAPKVNVSVHMAEVFGRRPLDFAVFFSSFQSFACASGQSNYAAGCAFKDAFAQMLARTWPCPVKVMNWGYWGSVGVVATPVNQERMAQIGVESIEAEEGMQALDRLLGGPFDQLAFLKTRQPLAAPTDTQLVELPQTVPSISASALSRQEGYQA
jgi:NAD(P)-dependent dehydrogenase (short-subunit alcohol dehydrogenase family)